jgi:hypothetical protein
MVAACELACGFSVKTWPGTVGMTDLFVYSWAIELLANESDSGKVDLLLDSAGAIQVGAVLQYNDELRDLVDRVLLLGPAPVPEGAFDGMDVIVLYHENDPITATWDLTEIFLGERVVSPLDIDGVRTVMSNEPRPPELDTPQERASFYHDGWWDVQIPGMFNQLADAVEGL